MWGSTNKTLSCRAVTAQACLTLPWNCSSRHREGGGKVRIDCRKDNAHNALSMQAKKTALLFQLSHLPKMARARHSSCIGATSHPRLVQNVKKIVSSVSAATAAAHPTACQGTHSTFALISMNCHFHLCPLRARAAAD